MMAQQSKTQPQQSCRVGVFEVSGKPIVAEQGSMKPSLKQSSMAELRKIDAEYHYFNHLIEKPEKGKFIVSVKDSICTAGIPTTAGSRILDGYVPRFDATCVERLKKAGGVVIGKTAMDEFGFGSFSINVGLGKKIPLNPFDQQRSCGGSSGGAAGVVQAFSGKVRHIALGQSTGGSIACPASFCGVVGLTPTYGRVSRYGLIDYASSMDKIGLLAKTVQECAEALEIIAGPDGKDATCMEQPKGFAQALGKDIAGMRIGVIKEAFGNTISGNSINSIDTAVSNAVRAAVQMLPCTVNEVSLPLTMKYGIAVYYLIAVSEASTNLAKFCGLRYGQEAAVEGKSFNEYFTEIRSRHLGPEAKRRIILGTFARMAGFRDAYYLKAMKIRTLIIEEYKKLFQKYDLLISPTMPMVAPTFAEIQKLTPVQNYMIDILTVGPNVAGLPHLSIPCGFDEKGLPIGMLLIADHWQEKKVIQVGDYYERYR